MKKTLLLLHMVLFSMAAFSQVVSVEKANIVAGNVYAERLFLEYKDLSYTFEAIPQIIYDEHNVPALFVYVCANRPGYIILSADYAAAPVFGYSFVSGWDEALAVPVFRDMLNNFTEQVSYARANKMKPTDEVLQEWELYSSEYFNKSNSGLKNLSPILQTTWNQGCYYNDLCPEDIQGPCGRVWAGCVATAMAQVMKFHNWPPQGQGSNIYIPYSGNYGTLSANFGQTTYNWDDMPNSLNENTNNFEAARLQLHCGISVEMNYGWDGSGAHTSKTATSLVEYFKYADYLAHMEKDLFSNSLWAEILRTEVHSDRPVLYRGYGSGGGHAFVCDGYQGSNFHFNLGWGGAANGYYSLANVAGFATDQAGIFSVEPKYTGPQYCDEFTLLTAPSGSISDGSGNNRYANNTNCKWLIQPENAGAILLDITYLKTEPGLDRILVYEGDSENSWLIADISGFDLPSAPVVVSGGSMFVWFITDEFNTSSGWEATYSIWATDIADYSPETIKIMPNPASDKVIVQLDSYSNSRVSFALNDMNGKQVFLTETTAENGMFEIALPSLSPGIYTAEVFNGQKIIASDKLIIQK